MARGRILWACGLALLAAGLGARFRDNPQAPDAWATRIEPGENYAVDVVDDRTAFDLEFAADSRYIVIASSLGDSRRTFDVELRSERVATSELLRARNLPLFRPRLIPRRAGEVRQSVTRNRVATSEQTVARREFFLHVTDGDLENPAHYARVNARTIAEGDDVRVYLDEAVQRRELFPGLADEVVRLLDDDLIPTIGTKLGRYRDVDGDGKFAVLLTPWLGKLQGGRTSIGGFVRGSDFRVDLETPFGNQCDMLFLNTNLTTDSHLRTLLAHEYTHAVCFSERLPVDADDVGKPHDEDWLNEAIAHVVETMHAEPRGAASEWSNLDYRISRFLNSPQRYPLVVADYYRAGRWRDHGCRGATYLFLRWCVDCYGEELLRRLMQSPNVGRANIACATGVPFAELYRRWTLALYDSGRQTANVNREGNFRSLDLRTSVGNWALAGPRPVVWNLAAPLHSIPLTGTSTTFIELRSTGKIETRRIHIRAEPSCRLQVSLHRLPDSWPRLEMDVKRSTNDDVRTLDVTLTGKTQQPIEVEAVTWEVNVDQVWRSETVRVSENAFHVRLNIPRDVPLSASILLKAVARDARGRRVSVWATVRPTGNDEGIAALAVDR
jgi:hypothetical protein